MKSKLLVVLEALKVHRSDGLAVTSAERYLTFALFVLFFGLRWRLRSRFISGDEVVEDASVELHDGVVARVEGQLSIQNA